MKATALIQAGVLALTCSFLATNVSAAIINVDNPSFETLPAGGLTFPCGTDCAYSLDLIPGWTNPPASTGQFQPGPPATTTYFDTLSDGPTSAFSTGPNISQMVVPTVLEGMIYTLLVDIGDRKDIPPVGQAALLINGVQYMATGSYVFGAFSTFTATYTGVAADAGQSITILLLGPGSFDNVRLSLEAAPAPEPGTMAMLGLGLTALGVLRRKYAA